MWAPCVAMLLCCLTPYLWPCEGRRPESDPAGGGFLEGVFRLLTLMKKIVAYYNNGLSLISLGFLGYFPGVVPVFLMYTIARLSSNVGKVTVLTSSMDAFNVLRALSDSPTSSS